MTHCHSLESLGAPHLPFPMWGRRWRHESRQQPNDWELHHVASSQLLLAPAKNRVKLRSWKQIFISACKTRKKHWLIYGQMFSKNRLKTFGYEWYQLRVPLGRLSRQHELSISHFMTICNDFKGLKPGQRPVICKVWKIKWRTSGKKKTQNITRYVLLTHLTPLK